MKHILLLLLFSATVYSQTPVETPAIVPPPTPPVIQQKITETFVSKKLNESREITIALPPSYETNSTKQYPVLVLLDGDYLFDPFLGALNYGAYWDDLPEIIIIGINQNKNDERINDSQYDELNNLPTEKGAQFFEFVGVELLPYIEKKYRVAPFRIIAGQDTTAGFLNFYLYKDNPVFNAYISLSPELAPEMEMRIPENLAKIKRPTFYYQSTADGDLKDVIESVKILDANIKVNPNPLLHYTYDHFKGATHYSAALYSIPNALYQFFDCYKPISMNEFTEKIAILQSGYVQYLKDKYDGIEKDLGYRVPVRTTDFKAIEAAILKNKAYDELDELSQIADKNYPKSMLANYELGLMYEKMDDPKRAAKAYQKATQMEPIGDLTLELMSSKFDEMQTKSQIQSQKNR
ncbi:MAG TPA: alpha/beta hydrolase-fold protein [Flavobacterium sp.]